MQPINCLRKDGPPLQKNGTDEFQLTIILPFSLQLVREERILGLPWSLLIVGARVDPDPALAGLLAEVVLPYPNRDQGNILTGIVNQSGAARSCGTRTKTVPLTTVSVTFVLDFNLKEKTIFTNNFGAMHGFSIQKFLYVKKCNFEPFSNVIPLN